MKVYLAGENGKHSLISEDMKVYLAGENGKHSLISEHYILESYYYARSNNYIEKLFPFVSSLILDSGAFTALQGNGNNKIDWERYIDNYAEFIIKNKIELFFELDIDSLIGLKEVERLRHKLERLTGKQSIPVWHKNRGLDYFVGLTKEYQYVALGGIVIKEIPRGVFEKTFPWFIDTAHTNGAKIHGLGYTSISGLHKYHFDSVDSSSWLHGNRGGYLYKFNSLNGTMEQVDAPSGYRLDSKAAAKHNYREWQKFQQYALINL